MTTPASNGSPRYQALLQLMRTADTLWNASHAFFARWNLTPSQFNVLNLLADRPSGLSQIELGRLLITHRSNVTGLVDRLEKRGLVARNEVAGDRRAYRVVVTAPGRKLLQQILPRFHEMADSLWSGIPASRVRLLAESLTALSRNADAAAVQKGDS